MFPITVHKLKLNTSFLLGISHSLEISNLGISGDGLCRVKLMHKFLVITFNRPRSAYIVNFYTPLTQANNEEFI